MAADKKDWQTRLNPDEQHFVKYNLGLFVVFDNVVINNLVEFKQRMQCMEIQAWFACQEAQEHVHVEAYMLQAEGILEGDELAEVLASVETMPAIAAAVRWARKYMDLALPDGDVLIAWACVEGVLFQSSFAGIQWLRERNLLPGVTTYNQFIARDENYHACGTAHVVRHELLERPSSARAHEIMREGLGVAALIVAEGLRAPLLHMTPALLLQYTEFQANCILDLMGYPALSRAGNPFPFMDKLALNDVAKANFFEKDVTQYAGAVAGSAEYGINSAPITY